MDHINSEFELDELFAETDALDDFIELEEMWKTNPRTNDHPFRRFLHRVSDNDYIDQWSNRDG